MNYIRDRILGNMTYSESEEHRTYSSESEYLRHHIMEDRKPYIEIMNGLIDEIHSLDDKIASLYTAKLAMMKEVMSRAANLANFFSLLGCSYDHLKEQFEVHCFNSEDVQKAISRLRSLFFDDNKKDFKDIVCTYIKFSDNCDTNDYAAFEFESMTKDIRFKISIPNGSNVTLAERLKYKNEYYGGKMYVSIYKGIMDKIVGSSYDLDVIRDAVDNVIHHPYDEIKEHDFRSYVDLPDKIQNIEQQMCTDRNRYYWS